jgi:Phosphopentomutase
MKTLFTQPWTRRRLLQATALSTGLGSFMSINALPAPPRKRVIFVFTPLGAPYEEWEPSGCGPAILLRAASAPLEPVKHHCVFLNNLFVEDGGLGNSQKVLGGGYTEARKTTLDVHLGAALSEGVLMPNLHLGTEISNEVISVKDYNRLAFARSSAAVYGALLNNEGVEANTPIDKKFRAELEASTRVSFDKEVDLQIELSALALSRNVTNVITLMWGDTQGDFLLPEKLPGYGGFSFHQAVHTSRRDYVAFRAYLSAKLAYLIQLLEVMRDENNQSLLETTLVVHVTDHGEGDFHTGDNAPYFIAGGKNLFHNGAVLNVARATQLDLMDTIAEAYGLQGVQYGTKKIEGLTRV